MRTHLLRTFLLISWPVVGPSVALASGACCSVSPGGKNQVSVAVIASSASSHEKIGGVMYDLRQQALMVRGTIPLGEGFFAGGTLGMPVRTSLGTSAGSFSGNLGWVYGVTVGAILPNFLPVLDAIFTVNYSRSEGRLSDAPGGRELDARFIITELQGVVVGELHLLSEATFYGGARFYSGKNKIQDIVPHGTSTGDREGNVSSFLGIRGEFWQGISLVAEGSLGHTRIVSLALIASM